MLQRGAVPDMRLYNVIPVIEGNPNKDKKESTELHSKSPKAEQQQVSTGNNIDFNSLFTPRTGLLAPYHLPKQTPSHAPSPPSY